MSRKRYPLRVARGARGIRAQDLRTLSRTAWWARRWIAALEAMRLGPRFGRGRQYAVAGQVTELELDGPHVEAVVVGSREAPYRLTLDFTAATGAARDRIADQISAEPMTLARLLTDGKPVYDVKMHCSCPDWGRPCKHLVAVLLLLGEEIARRPATLLSLRGVEVEDIVGLKDCRIEENKSSITQSRKSDADCGIFLQCWEASFLRHWEASPPGSAYLVTTTFRAGRSPTLTI